MQKQALAIIPARGGSKRIPRKNIRSFLGQPIIAYSIDAARRSGCFDTIMVSTEDTEIADIARSFGAEVPFMRTPKNADDFAMTADVILEVTQEYARQGVSFQSVCCLYPTAPFATPQNLRKGLALLQQSGAHSVVPVAQISYPIWKAFKIENERLSFIWPDQIRVRNNDVKVTYQDAAQFYWLNTDSFLQKTELFTENTRPLEISELEVQDIDTEADWQLAEMKYRLLQENPEVLGKYASTP